MYFHEYMSKAAETENIMSAIPQATLMDINVPDAANPRSFRAVVVANKIVATVSGKYKLVQHAEAFKPIFDGLHQVASDYDFALFLTPTKAFLNVYVDEIKDNESGIKLGFSAANSLDGRKAIQYTMVSEKVSRYIEIVGYRQVCSNGMKIRVPLDQAEFVKEEVRERVEMLLMNMSERIVHAGDVETKIQAVQYVVEAMALLKNPVAKIIEQAKIKPIGQKAAKALIAKYVGKRMSKRIYNQFKEEDNNLWGIYNAVTFCGSHNVKKSSMNGLLDRAATMLQHELATRD